MTTNPVPSPFR
ncbi:hypothetical protein VCHC32A1_1699, partial [Vibrio cholerae HC-32A1]